MAVVRKKEFVFNLGRLVEERLGSFSRSKARILAKNEANFQRMVVDNGLSPSEQLSYRKKQLKQLENYSFVDSNAVLFIKKSISNLNKLARQKKFRDKYNVMISGVVNGVDGLEQLKSFLQGQKAFTVDQETKDLINTQLLNVDKELVSEKQGVIKSEIIFDKKDGTIGSLNKALSDVKNQQVSSFVSNDLQLQEYYKEQLSSIQQQILQVNLENKVRKISVDEVSGTSNFKSLFRLNRLQQEVSTSNSNLPINLNGVNYPSEKDFWQQKLNQYVENNLVSDFSNEISNQSNLISGKFGGLTDAYLSSVSTELSKIKTNPAIAAHPDILKSLSENVSAILLSKRVNEIKNEIGFSNNGVSYHKIWQGKQEIQKYQAMFPDVSLQPTLNSFDERYAQLKLGQIEKIDSGVTDYMKANPGVTEIQARNIVAPLVTANIPNKTLLTPSTPKELSAELPTIAKSQDQKAKQEETAALNKATSQNQVNVNIQKPDYNGVSVVDYLKLAGQPNDMSSREKLAKQFGIENYVGTAEQNTSLLNKLKQK